MLRPILAIFLFTNAAAAQSVQLLPEATDFAAGAAADPREPRLGIGFLQSDLFSDPLAARTGQTVGTTTPRDTHGVIQLGLSRALLRVSGVLLGLQGTSNSRFRMDTSDNDALSVDYMVAVPITFRVLGTHARVRLIHRSAHLGDELVQNTSIRRLEFDHEEVDVVLSRDFGPLRVYGGGAVTIASSFEKDEGAVQAGVEGWKQLTGSWHLRAGVDWQRHALQDWGDQVNGVAGVERRGGGSWVRIQGRIHSGPSHLGEFFVDREKAWGAEVIFGY